MEAYRDYLHFEKTKEADLQRFNGESRSAGAQFTRTNGIYTRLDQELSILNQELVNNVSTTSSNEQLIIDTEQAQRDTLDQAVANGLFAGNRDFGAL